METKNIISAAVISAIFISCEKKEDQNVHQEIHEKVLVVNDKDTIKNVETTFDIKFDNAKNTAEINFNGDKATLKADTVASGIKYSNEKYEFREWHGEQTLTKDGKVVFQNKK